MDHICYRTANLDRYDALKLALSDLSVSIHESIVAGRPITIARLKTPYRYEGAEGDRLIEYIELPAPKNGSPYPEGWEHAEFVVPTTLQNFMAAHPHLEFNIRNLRKISNPEIALGIGDGLHLKFHEHPIWDVIAAEVSTK